ncbi:MAG: Uma2 family endonuclease [Gracilibacteraceae bacterium]|jgi:Uma2 family endonuclease|nr:Uma2 family endonuclease [Gracilibacteraceae bacterium]
MDNLAFDRYKERFEILNGEIYAMSPRPSVKHNMIAANIFTAFANYFKGKSCIAFSDGVDVKITENDTVIPDVMIVCNRSIIKPDAIYGSPDLVVEVLSPGTAKRDRGYKKDLYGAHGVKEYWIVDSESKIVEVYVNEDKEMRLDNVYEVYPDYMIEKMSEDERANIMDKIGISMQPDFELPLSDIFQTF